MQLSGAHDLGSGLMLPADGGRSGNFIFEAAAWLSAPLDDVGCPAGLLVAGIERTPLNALIFLLLLIAFFIGYLEPRCAAAQFRRNYHAIPAQFLAHIPAQFSDVRSVLLCPGTRGVTWRCGCCCAR